MGNRGPANAIAALSSSIIAACVLLTIFAFLPLQDSSAATAAWSSYVAPNYVTVTGRSSFDREPAAGEVVYSDLDALGRTRKAWACVTYQMTQEGREEFPEGCEPSGWGGNRIVTIKLYDGTSYRGYFWNRSHVIADSLGGDPNRHNLVKGTRTQNVGANDGRGGMAYAETKARNWLYRHHDGTVLYSAEPVYTGDELVPRTVEVDVRTSDGSIDEHVVVYNAALGYEIDYRKGSFSAAKVPSKVKKLTVKAGKRKLRAKWKAVPGAQKYRVSYRAKGSWKTKTVSKTSVVIKKLKSKKKYQVKVQAVWFAGGADTGGAWSKVKAVKVK